MKARLPMHCFWLLLFVAQMAVTTAHAGSRDCTEWEAVYVSHPDEEGGRVTAAFGAAEGTAPQPFTLAGVDAAGTVLWEMRTIAWCFLGAGGCFMDLKMTDGTAVSEDTENPVRLVFAASSKTDPSATPDILVVAGLSTELLNAQRGAGPLSPAVTWLSGVEDVVVPPEVYYFERCSSR